MSDPIRSIYGAIEFIEDHLKVETTVADIAAAAGYSLFHFIRIFNQIVHHTPYDYLIRRRLSEAGRDLIQTDQRIIDIALDYQFKNHETFSRAFKRMFAMQPSQWRERAEIPYRTVMPAFTRAYLEHINQPEIHQPELVERPETHFLGLMVQKRNQFSGSTSNFEAIFERIANLKTAPQFFGISSQLQFENLTPFYFFGIETSSTNVLFPPFVHQNLPAGPYAEFTHKGRIDQILLTMDYILHTWLPQSEYRPGLQVEIECFGENLPGEGTQSEWKILIPLKP